MKAKIIISCILFISATNLIAKSSDVLSNPQNLKSMIVVVDDTFEVVPKMKTENHQFKDLIEYLKDILTILGICFGSFIAYQALFRGVKSDILKKILDEDFEKQKNFMEVCHTVQNNLDSKLIEHAPLGHDEVAELEKIVISIDNEAYKNKPSIANASYFLKRIIQNVSRYYNQDVKDNGNLEIMTTSLYSRVRNIVMLMKMQSQKYTTFPSFWSFYVFSLKEKSNRNLSSKFVIGSERRFYKFYEVGISPSPISHDAVFIYSQFNSLRSPLISRAVFRVFNDHHAVLINLYLNKIYSPLKLETTIVGLSGKPYKYSLSGFSPWIEVGIEPDGSPTELFKLIYVTENDVEGVSFSVIKEDFFRKNQDLVLGHLRMNLEIFRIDVNDPYSITINVKTEVLKNLFTLHKREIEVDLKKFKDKEEERLR